MSKQEEIREGIINLPRMEEDGCDYEYCKKYKDNCPECRADTILVFLHSQGVVIKAGFDGTSKNRVFTTVEPLIEEL